MSIFFLHIRNPKHLARSSNTLARYPHTIRTCWNTFIFCLKLGTKWYTPTGQSEGDAPRCIPRMCWVRVYVFLNSLSYVSWYLYSLRTLRYFTVFTLLYATLLYFTVNEKAVHFLYEEQWTYTKKKKKVRIWKIRLKVALRREERVYKYTI